MAAAGAARCAASGALQKQDGRAVAVELTWQLCSERGRMTPDRSDSFCRLTRRFGEHIGADDEVGAVNRRRVARVANLRKRAGQQRRAGGHMMSQKSEEQRMAASVYWFRPTTRAPRGGGGRRPQP